MKTRTLISALFILLFVMPSKAQSPMNGLKKYTGDWKAVVTMWMTQMDMPMYDSLEVQNAMIMNDLFFTSRFSGVMMQMNYEGLRTIGYDLVKKKFVSTVMDNMSSGIDYKEGIANADGKSIEFHGSMTDAASGKPIVIREVITFINDTYMTIERFESADGNERKILAINLTKQ